MIVCLCVWWIITKDTFISSGVSADDCVGEERAEDEDTGEDDRQERQPVEDVELTVPIVAGHLVHQLLYKKN